MSLRSMGRFGSGLAISGVMQISSPFSLLNFVGFGSCCSLRSFGRLGAPLSVVDFVHLGCTVAVRGFARLGATLAVSGSTIRFGGNSKLVIAANKMDFYGGSNTVKGLAVTDTGGKLHGIWQADTTILTSDRRLKVDIRPLYDHLRRRMATSRAGRLDEVRGEGIGQWLLREIRPVSFKLRGGAEAKRLRFGFIADELERVLPEVVRTDRAAAINKKGVIYNDLIAVLTTVVQLLSVDLGVLKDRVRRAEEDLAQMDVV